MLMPLMSIVNVVIMLLLTLSASAVLAKYYC